MSNEVRQDRRHFLGTALLALAAAESAIVGSANAQPSTAAGATIATHPSLGPLKQIDAGVLNVGYTEAGPANGPVIILLHGWPYDIHSFVDVVPLLASAGYRVLAPFVRGYGTTRFLSAQALRNGQPSAVALDTVAVMDALKIHKATLAGFDWGARSANIVAALWPERCKAMVSVSGYLIGRRAAMVVSVLLRDRARPRGIRKVPARLRQADLADRFAEVEFRRRDLRAERPVIRQPGSRRHHGPQLPLASRARARRSEVRRLRTPPRRGAGHRRADDHARGRRQRRAASGAQRLCAEVLRPIRASAHRRRDRPQPAAGGPAGLCPGRDRRRQILVDVINGSPSRQGLWASR